MLSRCRLSLASTLRHDGWLILEASSSRSAAASTPSTFRRWRSGKAPKKPAQKQINFGGRPKHGFGDAFLTERRPNTKPFAKGNGGGRAQRKPPPNPDPLGKALGFPPKWHIARALESRVAVWASLPHVHRRLAAFGVPDADIQPILDAFVQQIDEGILLRDPEITRTYDLDRLAIDREEAAQGRALDESMTQLLYTWAADPATQATLASSPVRAESLAQMANLARAADMSYPAEWFPVARAMRRKVIMHVGPTNSGKTHNALRALAAARSGVYAGPLRLLAHEVWERLNKGQIVPLGATPDKDARPDTSSNFDLKPEDMGTVAGRATGGGGATVTKDGYAKYARACNLRTGEEIRIVQDFAGLTSCTVEMLELDSRLEVAVIDEIQMIADPERGPAWTNAVLGLPAKELHLCGEETAVPVIEAILRDTGDELIVNRYERLSPLSVEEQSLNGDWSRIRKGDCVVAFSRQGIFNIKREIEEATGLRCAVAYGKLPPEIRSEQAALFNDPDSEYDVMIGSDAIGMGLNLKIKRVVFDSLRKFDGIRERWLSLSQTKQIAGRAGRYGLHTEAGGTVTTLLDTDLPRLHEALATPAPPVPCAVLDISGTRLEELSHALPANSSMETYLLVPAFVSRRQRPFSVVRPARISQIAEFLDTRGTDLTLAEKMTLAYAPVAWSDPLTVDVLGEFCRMYRNAVIVDLFAALDKGPFFETLEGVEERAAELSASRSSASSSSGLAATSMLEGQGEEVAGARELHIIETLHKVLVLYLWLGNRAPAAYHQTEEAFALKARVERALDIGLQSMSWRRAAQKAQKVRSKKILEGWDKARGVASPPPSSSSGAAVTPVAGRKETTETPKIQWSRPKIKSEDSERRELAVKRARLFAERHIETDSYVEMY